MNAHEYLYILPMQHQGTELDYPTRDMHTKNAAAYEVGTTGSAP